MMQGERWMLLLLLLLLLLPPPTPTLTKAVTSVELPPRMNDLCT